MKKIICLFIIFLSSILRADCFIASQEGEVLVKEGECAKRYAPESTFKIVLSLIGFDYGILKDKNNPVWELPNGVDPYINACKGVHNPITWIRDSCLWYSRILTTKLGIRKFQEYITKFHYGNMDLSAGLADAWVSSSLKISPIEQISFIRKINGRELFVSEKSYDLTKKIMYIQELSGGWKLYGKTGSGKLHGWFIGFIEKDKRVIEFASHIIDAEKQATFASFRARNEALTKLWYLIDSLE